MTGNTIKNKKIDSLLIKFEILKKKNQSHVFCQQCTELGSLIGHSGNVSCYNTTFLEDNMALESVLHLQSISI